MTSKVIGSGPIGFTDTNGNQRFISLSALYFEGNEIKVSNSVTVPNYVKTLLQNLVDGGFLIPGVNPPPQPALILEAAIPGAAGNTIEVKFSNIVADANNSDNSHFDAEITAKYSYPELTLTTIENILGNETLNGSSPSIIRAKVADTPQQPTEGTYKLESNDGTKKSSKAIDGDPDGNAFTLTAWKEGLEGNNISITISKVNDTTFTLIAEYKSSVTAIKLTDLPQKLARDGIILIVKSVNNKFAIPAPGTVILSGGADAKTIPPSTAKAIALTSS